MLVPIGTSRVFVDIRGSTGSPALLYVHGGPGQGSYEFMASQGDRLARTLRVIGLDQRGVLRSDPLGTQSLTLDQLVADCAALRKHLEIGRWTVLAHSIGALIAIRYAIRDREHVGRLILDCPCLDISDSTSNLLARAESLLRDAGRDELGDVARNAQNIPDLAQRWSALRRIWQDLDDIHSTLYFRRSKAAEWFGSIWDLAPISEEERQRAGSHVTALQADPQFFQPVTEMLGGITQPSLLIKGMYDPVCTPTQLDAFQKRVVDQRVVVVPDAAHFPQLEQPDTYADHVAAFASDGASLEKAAPHA